ncbi:hypothetical protein [Paenibacillus sp. GYB003]|uniref:hypothetical protein n=1 Tax=Paenibacillus sp. GYB003 TaxID=2994392 RepID=UPI002F96A10F
MATEPWEDAKKYALAGGSSKFGSFENYQNQTNSTTSQAASRMAKLYGPPAPAKPTQPTATTLAAPAAPTDFKSILTSVASRFTAPQAQFQFNPETNASFQAAAKLARQGVGTAQANTNARLRATGQGRSSYSETVANQIAQQAENDIATRLLPQYEQMEYGRFRDEQDLARQNALDLLAVGRDMNALEQQGLENARADASITGQYLPPKARDIIDQILNLKRQAERGNVSTEQMTGYRNQADRLRAELALTGVDPNIVGYEADYDTAVRNVAGGFPTLQARTDQRNFDYRQQQDELAQQNLEYERQYREARDSIEDERYKQKFDEDVRRFGLEYALQEAAQANQFANAAADNARANAQLALQHERFEFDKEQANRPRVSTPTQTQQNNAFVAEVTTNLDRMPANKKAQFFKDERETLINQLGISGYNQLYNLYFDNEGNPK